MFSKRLSTKTLFWLFVLIPFITAILFRKSFDLGLYGDDWQHLYILWKDFFVYHTRSFWDIRSYLNPYFPEYLYLGIINHFWGYYPPAYFIASYLCRIFANIGLYFFAYELTKNKPAAFFASLFFLLSATGLQTTDWVFNMNTYVGLGLLAISSVIYLKIRDLSTFKSWYYPVFIITYTLALAVVPTRMHAATPFILFLDIFLTFFVDKKYKITRYFIVRMLVAVLLFAMLIHVKSFGEGSYTQDRLRDSYKLIELYTQNGYKDIYFYYLGILGHIVMPDTYSFNKATGFIQNMIPLVGPMTKMIMTFTSIAIILCVAITFVIFKKNYPKAWVPAIIFNILLALFLKFLTFLNPSQSSDVIFSIALGSEFLFWTVWVYIMTRNIYPLLASSLIIGTAWTALLSLIYWVFTPYFIIETTGRYMSAGAVGFALFFGSLIAILIKSSMEHKINLSPKSRFYLSLSISVPAVLLLIWLPIQISTTQDYFNVMHQNRNREVTERAWNKLVEDVPTLYPSAPSVFFFTTDNPSSLYGVLTYGFYMRAGITWGIPVEHMTPLPCSDYNELLEYVKTGSPLQKVHGRKASPMPISRVFAFDFSNGVLTNITEDVRKKLMEDLDKEQIKYLP